jgi:hypothetical protein
MSDNAPQVEKPMGIEISLQSRVRGCLLGGAIGDALGAPVEFMRMPQVKNRFGPDGIVDYAPAYGRIGAITDDTQMTLFTAEGLMRAFVRQNLKGICSVPSVVCHAYLRWLATQGVFPKAGLEIGKDGWLWGGHRVVYIFTEVTGRLNLYYDIELRKPIDLSRAGGGMFRTTTLITNNRIFVPVPEGLQEEFKVGTGPKEFFVRFDVLSSPIG